MEVNFMRNWRGWCKDLADRLRASENVTLSKDECERFLEVEYCLCLHNRLIPEQSCLDTWTLLTGYTFAGVNDTPLARRICAIARHRVRYFRTATSWKKWLTWYTQQRSDFRLYDVDLSTGHCQQHEPLTVLPERLSIYDEAIESVAEHRQRRVSWAKACDYTFPVLEETYNVRIPLALTQLPRPVAPKEPPLPGKREPIEINFDDLERAAAILQSRDPAGDWIRRARNLHMDLVHQDILCSQARRFTIDGLFHLIGMVGAGKSTLISLLIYHLAVERKLHVTLMLNTVAECIHMAATLQRLGITAAPAQGRDRGAHRLKYGQAHAESLQLVDLLQPDAEENPALAWVTGACAISGAMTEGGPIPSGYEPCYGLMDAYDQPHSCPVRPVCPVHQASQDLPSSQVWVVNPASFIASSAPEGLCTADMRLLEAIYRVSDVLIIDEADRVQVQWDRTFAPVDTLAGSSEALLDWLDLTITEQIYKRERRPLAKERYKELNMVAGEADRLSSHLIHLLFNHRDLVKWTDRLPLTNALIYAQLLDALARPYPDGDIDPDVRKRLEDEFQQFREHPTSLLSASELAQWINDVRYDEEVGLSALLRRWLQKRVPWQLTDHSDSERLIRRLEFALTLTAMDKRVDHLLRDWGWAASEFGQQRHLEHNPPTEYIDLVPESPLGNLLGYQYFERKTGQGGVLKYIQCYGIGRWLLTNFPFLYTDLDGIRGPHVLLTSATSWAPGSPQFHLAVPPQAILSASEEERRAIDESTFEFIPVPEMDGTHITVSGTQGTLRQKNLEKLARYLGSPSDDGHPSRLEQELTYWRAQGTARRILILVGSYAGAEVVTKLLLELPGWRDQVTMMLPDDDDSLDAWAIRRGEIEQLINRKASIVVAPLLAIQRGFNILDEAGGALLGSAFFLVRPYPVPDDLSQHVIGINHWMQTQLSSQGNCLPSEYGVNGQEAMGKLRRKAFSEWNRRLTSGQYGLDGLPWDLYQQLLWDQFVVVWQTIGRLVRRGRKARIFFVDAAFHPGKKRKSYLRGWYTMLRQYLGPESTKPKLDQQFAEKLYGSAYRALEALIERLEGNDETEKQAEVTSETITH
jgi:hypothetical protein